MAKTPAAIMREAYDAEVERWMFAADANEPPNISILRIYQGQQEVIKIVVEDFQKAEGEMIRLSGLAGMRAALRALAAMEPSEEMMHSYYYKTPLEECASAKAFILAAAAEGEKEEAKS
jgi:hypothetical protein